MKIYKDKQYLVFDYENGKTVKYDFATKTAIGFKGKPVKDLKSQLKNLSITQLIECCEDPQYAKFLRFIKDESDFCISNIGTMLERVPKYARYEQLFSAGFEDICDMRHFQYTINDVPKSLVKMCRNNKIRISNILVDVWKDNVDACTLAFNLDYMSLNSNDLINIFTKNSSSYYWHNKEKTYFEKLIKDHGYNPKSLFLYIDKLKTFEAIEDTNFIIKELYDYVNMMSAISNKYDKYPSHFLTTHRIACRNYIRLKKEFQEDLFKNRIDKNLEYTYKDYKFIYPDCVQDIKDEAVSQNNCVASYIENVIDGKCHILFLRKKDSLDKSLVTIEVRDNKIVQAKRKFNYPVTNEDQEAIDVWNKKFSK